jgi:predicted enzyme related to lactoylglutathione lyase
MAHLKVSAVLFAKDLAKLATFYRETLGLEMTKNEADHTVLRYPGFDLIVHQIPPRFADSIVIADPPQRRERGAIKLGFPVASIERARTTAASLGGVIDPPSAEWNYEGATICPGNDPEGNVFQVSAPAR